MDPLSITAAVIGISKSITGVASVFQWIASLKNVSLEFLDLQNELGTVQGYLDILRRILNSLDVGQQPTTLLVFEQISTCLKLLEGDVNNMHQLSNSFVTHQNTGDGKVQKINWKRHKGIIEIHRGRIRRRRLDLSAAVALLQPVQSQSHATLLLAVQEINRTNFEALSELVQVSTERLQSSITSTGLSSGSQATTTDRQPPIGTTHDSQFLNFTATAKQRCKAGCYCQCHHRREVKSSSNTIISKVLGQLFLSYSCLPIWGATPCNYAQCENNAFGRPESATLCYIFPSWLVRRSLSVSASWGTLAGHGAKLHIRIPRVLPRSHNLWQTLGSDSVPGLQQMLSTGQLLFTDTNSLGESVFYLIFSYVDSSKLHEFCLSLVGELGEATVRQVWPIAYRMYYWNCMQQEKREMWRRLLVACGDDNDNSTGTPIHETILQWQPRAGLDVLENVVRANVHCINVKDRLGESALHWAARRNNLEAIRLLLAYGADIEVRDKDGATPLLASMLYESFDAAMLLLDNNANVNAASTRGRTSLMVSTQSGSIPAKITKQLLACGAYPMPKTSVTGFGAIHLLAGEFPDTKMATHSRQKLDLLLGAGVNIDDQNNIGQSSLLFSAAIRDHLFVKALLERGASVDIVDAEGKGLLQHVARNGTWEMFEVIRLHHHTTEGGCRIDPYLESVEGLTAADCFKQRVEQMQQATKPRGGSVPKESLPPVSQRDIEDWVRLMDDVQSCSAYLHRRLYGPEAPIGVGV
ncbi:hypothetical protein QBC44DRAFT_398062 [Cladorrhinum sp. PSN332]|nr:hypothetical protein QBC44DRAFT_398062 [Cladorrhinum sp. PSN332]